MPNHDPRRESVRELLAYFDQAGYARQTMVMRNRENNLPYWSVQNQLRTTLGRGAEGLGSGISRDPLQACLSAIGESAERLYLSMPLASAPFCRGPDLPAGRVLAASEWPTFEPAQLARPLFPFRPYDPGEERHWVELVSLATDRPCWVPAELVSVAPLPSRFMPGISTGAATHTDRHSALLSGLLEVVERDAFAIVWEARATVPLLDPQAAWQAEAVREMAGFFAALGIRFLLRDMSNDLGIPSVLAVLHDPAGRRPAFALGAAARGSQREACLKAAEEAYHTWTWMTDEHGRPNASYADTLAALEMPDLMMRHPYLYGFPEASAMVPHLLADAPRAPASAAPACSGTPAEQLRALVATLARHGHDVLACDLVPPAEAPGHPLHVVKVVIPGLVPLSIGRPGRLLANPRIRAVPWRREWPHLGPCSDQAWVPHPFP